MSSLFGHLAPRFASNPEDVATDALAYVLRSSESARGGFVDHVNLITGTTFGKGMRFSTRAPDPEGGIPDLVGTTPGRRLLVEIKFWAGLTARQSEGYVDVFSEDETGACVFLVPERRVEHVLRSLKKSLDEVKNVSSNSLELESGAVVAVTSWSTVLAKVESRVQEYHEEGRHQVLNDIRQLRGLCERLDAQAFHPVRKAEVGPDVAKRHLDFKDLVDEVKKTIKGDGFPKWKNTGQSSSSYHSHRFGGRLYGIKYFFGVMYKHWERVEVSPFWVKFRDTESRRRRGVKSALRPDFEVFDHPGLEKDMLVPIELKLNADRSRVLSHFENQLSSIASNLGASFGSDN